MRLVKVKVKHGWEQPSQSGEPEATWGRERRRCPEELVIQLFIWQPQVLDAFHCPELLCHSQREEGESFSPQGRPRLYRPSQHLPGGSVG